ncbi:mucin-2-like [Portunus trituberculatus]|uniref:mucin-2-like n=1 Tax=Portunus trituberculatus TaxID=210409 RepID=UPI001E1D0FDE|nr:mucin-2-like [Portunus trituberculatus]
MGSSNMGVRQNNDMQILFSTSRHECVQEQNSNRGGNSAQVSELLPGTQCLEPKMSHATHDLPTPKEGNTAAYLPHLLNLPLPPHRWTPPPPSATAALPPLSDYPPLPMGPTSHPQHRHTSGHVAPPATHPPTPTQALTNEAPQASSHMTPPLPSQGTSTDHHHPATTASTREMSEPLQCPSLTLHPPTTNTADTITQRSLQDKVKTLRQEVKTLKLNQDILQKANQDLQTMVAALHVTLKEEMSSLKALLMELASQTKITFQVTAAPGPSTHMDVDDTLQQTKIPVQHTSKPLPRGEASNTTDQVTLRKDNTNDDLINHAHLPPALPSSQPLHSTSPPQLPQQLPHLSTNTKQALPPQHSTISKDLANLPPVSLSSPPPLSISLPQQPPQQPPHPSANITQQPCKTLSEHSNKNTKCPSKIL